MPVQRPMLHGHPSGLTVSPSCVFPMNHADLAVRAVRISPEEAHDIGMPKDFVKISEKHGGGYPVHVEGFHHLHCLVSRHTYTRSNHMLTSQNLLRQTNYYNYEHYRDLGQGAFKNDEFIVKRHVSKYLTPLQLIRMGC